MRAVRTVLAALLALLFCEATAFAQGCPMCKEAASALGEGGQSALNHGILLLMAPVALALATVGYLIFTRLRDDRAHLAQQERPIVPPPSPSIRPGSAD